jgi:glyoxylase-like metal-dependent hydrolase (beta-lactamase superfamily II)
MFGVVPKTLWSRRIEPDERNRIPLAMRCLLLDTPDGWVLVDSGVGKVDDDKFRDIYAIENTGTPTRLEDSLRELGVEPGDIACVVSTHLHFDHAGGNTVRRDDGEIVPAFPAARYLIRAGEWEAAHSDNRRIRASYLPANFDPLAKHAAVDFVSEDVEAVPGVRLVRMSGHTAHHQGVLVDLGRETVCYLADLVPTSAHVRLPWIMAYDLEPLVTLAEKERILTRAGEEGWRLVFEHDPVVASARAVPAEGGVGCRLEEIVEQPLAAVD